MRNLICAVLLLFAFTIPCLAMGATISASHILIAVDASASPGEKEAARLKAEKIRQRLLAGESFATLAKAESDCPSKNQGGDLGSFGKGVMDPVFERAAFALKTGEISPVVATRFGYHIIKATTTVKPEMTDSEFEGILARFRDCSYHCKTVSIPSSIDSQREATNLKASIRRFSDCYNAYVTKDNDLTSFLSSRGSARFSADQQDQIDALISKKISTQKYATSQKETLENDIAGLEGRLQRRREQIERENERRRDEAERQNSRDNYNNSYNSSERFVPTPIPQRSPYVLPGMK